MQVGQKVLPITAQAINRVLGIPCQGDLLPGFTWDGNKKARKELRKLCDAKVLKLEYIKEGKEEQYKNLTWPEVPRWFLEKVVTNKDQSVSVEWAVHAFLLHCPMPFSSPPHHRSWLRRTTLDLGTCRRFQPLIGPRRF